MNIKYSRVEIEFNLHVAVYFVCLQISHFVKPFFKIMKMEVLPFFFSLFALSNLERKGEKLINLFAVIIVKIILGRRFIQLGTSNHHTFVQCGEWNFITKKKK